MYTETRNRPSIVRVQQNAAWGSVVHQQQPRRRPRSNTLPRDLTVFGIIVTDKQRRIGFNTLVIASLALSGVFALAGAYAGLYNDVDTVTDPWMIAFPSIFSAGLVVFTYAWGGWLRHGDSYGWAFFQPGKGGKQFVLLQMASWFCVAISLVIPWMPWMLQEFRELSVLAWPLHSPKHNGALLVVSSAVGIISQILTVTSLFAYKRPSQKFAWRFLLTERPDGKSFLYFFMSVQTGLACYAVLVLFITERLEDLLVGSAATLAFVWLIAVSTSLTHGVGGPWLRGEEGFTAFQPGRGGWRFVLLQFFGWSSLSLAVVIGICRSLCMMLVRVHPIICLFANDVVPDGAASLGALGLFSQVILTISLFAFEESELEKANRYYKTVRKTEKAAWISTFTGLPPEVKAKVLDYL